MVDTIAYENEVEAGTIEAGSDQRARQFPPGRVTVFGAGIAGLTAAHELVERGFKVIVVEPEAEGAGGLRVGGLARSQLAAGEPEQFQTGAVVMPWTLGNKGGVATGAREGHQRHARSFLFEPGLDTLSDRDAALGAASDLVREFVREVSRQALDTQRERTARATAYIRVTGFAAPYGRETAHEASGPAKAQAPANIAHAQGQGQGQAPAKVAVKRVKSREKVAEEEERSPACIAEKRATFLSNLLAGLLVDRLGQECDRLKSDMPDEPQSGSPDESEKRTERRQMDRRRLALEAVLKHQERALIRYTTRIGSDPGDCRAVAELAWEGEVPLPGEHGYRFFPSFYRHLFDTMKRTPLYLGGKETHRTALDNLTETNSQVFSGALTSVGLTRSRPRSAEALRAELTKLLCELKFSVRDILAFQAKVFRYMTTSSARRAADYENVSWWDFLTHGGVQYTQSFEEFIKAAPQALVAMDAETCDARTQGNIVVQLLLDQLLDSEYTDSTLVGPTSDAWFEVWREHLVHQGVTFLPGRLVSLKTANKRVELLGISETVEAEVELQLPGEKKAHNTSKGYWSKAIDDCDYYVVATDVVTAEKVTEELTKRSLPQVLPGLPGRVGGVPVQLREFVTYVMSRTDVRIKAGDDADWDRLVRERRAVAGFPSEYWGHLRHREELPAWVSYAEEQDLRTGNARPQTVDGYYIYGLTKRDRFQTFSGVQYYFAHGLEQARGHVYYFDTEWGLSSISQLQFWQEKTRFRKSGLLGVLSVDIGNFRQRSNFLGKAAHECTKEELAHEVWRQISESLRRGRRARAQETQRLPLPRPVYYHVDDFLFPGQPIDGKRFCATSAPFLVNNVGDWVNRPGSDPWDPETESIPRDLVDEPSVWQADHGGYQVHYHKVVFAGTYMRTFTRMTTMEAANESARHAVNAILDHLAEVRSVAQKDAGRIYGGWIAQEMKEFIANKQGLAKLMEEAKGNFDNAIDELVAKVYDDHRQFPLPLHSIAGEHCKIWNLERYELDDLAFLKRVDQMLFEKGLPHMADILDLDGLAASVSPLQSGPEGLLSALLTTAKRDWAIDDDTLLRGAKGFASMLTQIKDALGKLGAQYNSGGAPPP